MLVSSEVRKQLQETGKYMMDYELAWGNAGNISGRVSEDRYLISGSGTFLGELEAEDLVECSFTGGAVDPSARKPSKELPMHRAVYEERPEINAVLHASPFYSTLLACSDIQPESNVFIESMYYLERIERVPYCHPGSEALGEEVRAKAAKANILILENHGVLVYDTTIKEARMALQTLEMTMRMIYAARHSGLSLRLIDQETVQHFLHHANYRPRRKWEA